MYTPCPLRRETRRLHHNVIGTLGTVGTRPARESRPALFRSALGAFLAGVAFLAGLPSFFATWAPCGATRAFFGGFRLLARWGLGAAVFLCSRCGHILSFCGDHRGHDIHHSGAPGLQVDSGAISHRRLKGDDTGRLDQMRADEAR